jgi:hypothetical protein
VRLSPRAMPSGASSEAPGWPPWQGRNAPASVYEGPEGFLRFAQTDWGAFDEVTYEPQDFVARGAYVVVPIKQSGKGKGSALGVEESIVNVWKLRAGKCVELRNYSTIGEALAAIGAG